MNKRRKKRSEDKILSTLLFVIGIICMFVVIVLIAAKSEQARYDAHIIARCEDFEGR